MGGNASTAIFAAMLFAPQMQAIATSWAKSSGANARDDGEFTKVSAKRRMQRAQALRRTHDIRHSSKILSDHACVIAAPRMAG
jgi:hypothetical protein